MQKIWRSIKNEILAVINFIVVYFPNETIGNYLRKKYWSHRFRLGKNPIISRGAQLYEPRLCEIGDNFLLGENALLIAGNCNGVFIGNDVRIADGCYIRTANHRFDDIDIPIYKQGSSSATIEYNGNKYSVVLENNIWIGARAIILSGAHIGTGSIIAAGSVVSGKIPPYSIVVGNPGRVAGNRMKRTQV